ncbi:MULTISPECIES: GumC family protein [unclassified Sinorhizobium]|uniref:GumC family protein n=1 Tax=unclassified Sinorhizobium TaxID=2613772 RepID=UPI003525FB5A
MAGVSSNREDVDIDLGQLVRAVWQRWPRVLAATAIGAAVAFAATKMIAPEYKSETRILIEPRAPAFANTQPQGDAGQGPLLDELNIVSQVQILQSADLIKQVIGNLKLYELPEFDPAIKSSALSDILVKLGLKRNPRDTQPEERVLNTFMEKLQVYQVTGSRVIGISFTSNDPKLAAAVPNAMANVYLSIQSGAKLDSNSEATRWLEPEIASLRQKVSDAEKKVAEYRASHGLLPTSNGATFPTQQLNDISTELARVRGEKANAEARAGAVRNALSSGHSADTLPDIVASQSIQRLKATESGLESQISDLSTTMLEGHPRLKSLRAQLADIRSQIKRETQKILASLENEAKVADLREQQILQQSNTLKANSAQAGEDQVGLNALEREAAAERQLLETYLARYREAASRADKDSSPADARIVSRASQPADPNFPKVIPIVIVVSVATFIMSAIIIMLAELFSGRALRPVAETAPATLIAELTPAAGLAAPALDEGVPAKIPASETTVSWGENPQQEAADPVELESIGEDEQRVGLVDEDESDDYSIEAVTAHLMEGENRVATVISPTGDDGSAATVTLARMLADAGRRTILVDMTISGYPTRLMSDVQGSAGITDLLCGEAAFTDTIHGDRLSDAHFVPQGRSDIRRAMRGADRLLLILDAFATAYDVVLVECGAADIEGIARLTRNRETDIILSMPTIEERQFVSSMTAFEKAGLERVILMSGADDQIAVAGGRYAA